MNASTYARQTSWSTRLLVGLVLIIIGAAAATWALARYQPAARFLGVVPASSQTLTPRPVVMTPPPQATAPAATAADEAQRVAEIEARLARVENVTQRAAGSAGRADALVVAFAARRAIDRGVALGYLERLLISRFGHRTSRGRHDHLRIASAGALKI